MPPGMKINFDETNMTEWEVLLDGPDQSVYAVCINALCPANRVLRRC